MEYFKHIYNGVEYEFKPNRISQAKIQEIQRQKREEIDPELSKKMPEMLERAAVLQAELEKKQKLVENAKTEEEKAKLNEETKPLVREVMELQLEMKPLSDVINTIEVHEQVMFILLDCAKNEDGSKKYADLTKEKFELLLDSIEREYGLDEYFEICEAIAEDVFTMSGEVNAAEPQKKSEFLRKRQNRK